MNPRRFYYEIENQFSFYHGFTQNPEGFDVHIHRSYEIMYWISGDATYFVEGQSYDMRPDDLIFTNTRELHKIVFNSNEPYERIFIQFKPELTMGLQQKDFNPLSIIENRPLGHSNRIPANEVHKHKIDVMFQKMYDLCKSNTPMDNLLIKTTLIELLVALNQLLENLETETVPVSTNSNKINNILVYINNNLSEKISLDLLEKKFFINKYYLSHVFKQTTGFSLIEYITHKRVMEAKEMLIKGFSATETANTVGYSDYSSFYRVFKKIVGISPQQYLQKWGK